MPGDFFEERSPEPEHPDWRPDRLDRAGLPPGEPIGEASMSRHIHHHEAREPAHAGGHHGHHSHHHGGGSDERTHVVHHSPRHRDAHHHHNTVAEGLGAKYRGGDDDDGLNSPPPSPTRASPVRGDGPPPSSPGQADASDLRGLLASAVSDELESRDTVAPDLPPPPPPPPDGGLVEEDGSLDPLEAPRVAPFELRVLEAALEAVCSRLEADVAAVEAAAPPALDALTRGVSRLRVERVKRLRAAIARLQTRCGAVRSELQRLLDDDSDMRDMHLTRKAEARATALSLWLGVRTGGGGGGGGDTGAASGDATAPPPHDGATPDVSEPPDAPPSPFRVVPSSPHHAPPPPPGPPPAVALMEVDLDDDADIQDLEDLLETFFSNVDHTSNRLVVLAEHVANTESYVNIDLDSQRNKILELTVLVGLAALVHGVASALYGVFGMNYILTQPGSNPAYYPVMFRDSTGMFKFIASFTAGVSILIWFAIVYYLRFKGLIHILPLPKGWDDRVKAREWAREWKDPVLPPVEPHGADSPTAK